MNVRDFLHTKSKHKIRIIFYNYYKHVFHTKKDVAMNWFFDSQLVSMGLAIQPCKCIASTLFSLPASFTPH
jgi:hypothetical protein